NQLELAVTRDVDGAVGDLDVLDSELLQPTLVVVEPVARVHDLEERPAHHDRLVAQHLELPVQVAGHPGRAPAELDDVGSVAARLEDVLPRARAEALVEDVREPAVAGDSELKVVQGFPPVVAGP